MNQEPLGKLEQTIVQSVDRLKDEIINFKDIIFKNLQDENVKLKKIAKKRKQTCHA